MKKLRFRDTLGQKMRILAFAALGFSAMASCQPKAHVKKNPLVEHKQTKTEAHEPVKGTWKDGECWIEGRDTIVYSYRIGKNKAEAKKFTADIFLENGEEAKEIQCSEKRTYILTDRNVVMLVGADNVYFGKGEFYLSKGTIRLNEMKGKIIDWIATDDAVYFLTQDFFRYSDLHSEKSLDFEGAFNSRSRMIKYKGFVFVVMPGQENPVFAFSPDKKGEYYSLGKIFDGDVSFRALKDWLEVSIGSYKIAIEIEKGEIRISWI